jgi:integrase
MGVSVNRDAKGWRVGFQLPDGRRGSVRLGGAATKRHHDEVAGRMRSLIAARVAGVAPDAETAAWLAKCDQRVHERLATLGLTPSRARDCALIGFVDAYMAEHGRRIGAKLGSVKVWGRARVLALEYFGSDRLLSSITTDDAHDFRAWLLQRPGRQAGSTMAEATVRKMCSVISQVMETAVKTGVIATNPFNAVPRFVGGNDKREAYVSKQQVQQVVDAASDPELRLLIVLARLAGLRVPSEVRGLTWSDVDWSERSLRVHSPKTARCGKAWRLVPLCPELYATLESAYHAAPEGDVHLLPRLRKHSAPTMPLLRAIRSAGMTPWPRLFHTLRASCITDWHHHFALGDVAAWAGNTVAVAARHYVRAVGEAFTAATRGALGVLDSSQVQQSGVRGRVLPAAASRCHDVPKHTQPPMMWQDVACAGDVVHAGADTAEVREWTVLDSNTREHSVQETPSDPHDVAGGAPALGCIRGAENDLQLVIGAWARLSPAVRQAVVVIVQGARR